MIVDLLENKNKLKEERDKYSKWKSRIEGVSSSGKMGATSYTSYSSDNFSNSNYSNTYSGEINKKRDIPYLSSSSSEDEKEKKKKKRNKKINNFSDEEKTSSSEEEKKKKKKPNNNNKNEIINTLKDLESEKSLNYTNTKTSSK